MTQSALCCVKTTHFKTVIKHMPTPCRTMLAGYKINVKEIGLSASLKQWYKMLKQRASLEFEVLPDMDTSVRVRIKINVRLNFYAVSTSIG